MARPLLRTAGMLPLPRGFLQALAAVSFAAPAAAQPAPPVFTLHQAVEYSRAHQPAERAAQARVEVARLEAEVPRAGWLPRVGLTAQLLGGTANNSTASYATVSSLDVVRIGGTPAGAAVDWAPAASSLLAAGVRQELFDFGRISAQAAVADHLSHAAEARRAGEQLDFELFVEEAWFGVQGARAVLRASEAAYQRARSHQELAAAGVKSGLRPPIELTRADADLTRFEVAKVRADGSLQSARGVLAAAIGFPEPAVDAADEAVQFPPAPPLAEAIDRLESADPAIRELSQRLAAQQQRSVAIGAELRPDLGLSAGLNARGGGAVISGRPELVGKGLLPVVPNWDALVVLSWPVLDPVVWARTAVSRQEEQVRSAELDQARLRVRTFCNQTYIEEQVARAALPALQRSVEAAKANHAQAEARFKAGLGTSTELADAEALLTGAEIELAIGAFTQARARARLGRAISEAAP